MSSPAPRASRRAVLAGGAAAATVLLAGCGDETGSGNVATDSPVRATDSDLVDRVGRQVAQALALATATGTAFPVLRPLTRRLSTLHEQHLDELSKPADGRHGKVRGDAATARVALLQAEDQLQARMVEAALAAESGALAQVFAAMAAALAQQQVVAA
ncbi:hypothetical protein [Nocardioides stalactiti]|uniref:hypothetical protein n=1 Tax=Nocardioides stalactiti TaxID=2755356 RepID=UPI0016023A31|nr:hypothetical protein [Nocardioides stalactiti]